MVDLVIEGLACLKVGQMSATKVQDTKDNVQGLRVEVRDSKVVVQDHKAQVQDHKGKVRGQRRENRRDGQDNQGNHVGSMCIVADKLHTCCVQNDQVTLQCGHTLPVPQVVPVVCATICQY